MDDLKKFKQLISARLASGKKEPDFFEVVRRFDQLSPDRPRTGYARRSKADILHFCQTVALHFPETSMDSLQESPDGTLRLLVNFFGLSGVNGPLPLEYTSMVFQRSHNHYDHTMQRFLDIINHPFLRMYYRAYADHSAAICCDRPDDNLNEQIFKILLAMPDGIESSRKQRYFWMAEGRYMINSRRSRIGLLMILSDVMHIPVRIEERITEQWNIPTQYHCHLGESGTALLGVNAQIGCQFLTNTRKIKIHWGPLNFSQYLLFLPGKSTFYDTAFIISRFLERPLEYDFVFRLKTETLPQASLNGSVALGQSAWLGELQDRETSVQMDSSRIFMDFYKKETGNIKNRKVF